MKLTFLLTALFPSTTWGADSFTPYGSLCKDVPYKTSADVIKNLNSFSNLYVKFGNCAYSAQYTIGEEVRGGGGDEGWYMGFQYSRGANVAYSLYGSNSAFGGCSSSTFINSFYTLDGLYSFASATGVSLSSVPSNSNYRKLGGDNKENQVCTSAVTCGNSKKAENSFIYASFTDGMCQPSGYSATTDTLDSLNKDLSKQSCVKISSDTALSLLMYSQTCSSLSGSQCPDPHGILEKCEQTYQDFDQFVALEGKDPTKPTRYVYSFMLLLLAFVIYGFALMKKEKMESELRDQQKADLVVEKGVSAAQAESLVKPAATEYHPLSIQNAAISFARSVSMVAQPAINVIKDVLEDDDEEEEDEEMMEKHQVSASVSNEYVPPMTQDPSIDAVDGKEKSTSAPVMPSSPAADKSAATKSMSKKKKKKGLMKKIAKLFKKK